MADHAFGAAPAKAQNTTQKRAVLVNFTPKAQGTGSSRSPRMIHGTIRRHPVGLVDSQLIELQLFGPRRAACTD